MKITMEKWEEKEIEVVVKYPELDAQVTAIVTKLESLNHYVFGNDNGRVFRIHIYDIYYIESVDKKTFIYTKNQVFRSELKLYNLAQELETYEFIQVSKSCILNLNVLESVESLYNSKMQATLENQEKITISRTYLQAIKSALRKEGK